MKKRKNKTLKVVGISFGILLLLGILYFAFGFQQSVFRFDTLGTSINPDDQQITLIDENFEYKEIEIKWNEKDVTFGTDVDNPVEFELNRLFYANYDYDSVDFSELQLNTFYEADEISFTGFNAINVNRKGEYYRMKEISAKCKARTSKDGFRCFINGEVQSLSGEPINIYGTADGVIKIKIYKEGVTLGTEVEEEQETSNETSEEKQEDEEVIEEKEDKKEISKVIEEIVTEEDSRKIITIVSIVIFILLIVVVFGMLRNKNGKKKK